MADELLERRRLLAEHADHNLRYYQRINMCNELSLIDGLEVVVGTCIAADVTSAEIECSTCEEWLITSEDGGLIL